MRRYRVKGSHVAQAKVVVDQKLGVGSFARLARRNGGDASWDGVTISDWYDVFVLHKVIGIVARETRSSVTNVATEVGRHNALHDLKTIHRLFLRIAQPVRMLYFAPQLWHAYVEFGEPITLKNELGAFAAKLANIPESLIDWVKGSSLGFIPTGIELAGGRVEKASITDASASGDASSVSFEVNYHMK